MLKKNFNSFLYALIIQANTVALFFENSSRPLVYIVTATSIMTIMRVFQKRKLHIRTLMFILLVLFLFQVNFLFNVNHPDTFRYFYFFISVGILGIISGMLEIDYEYVLHYITLIGFPVIISLLLKDKIKIIPVANYYGYLLSVTYILLPTFLASIVNLKTFRSSKNLLVILLNMANFILIGYSYIKVGGRGVFVVILFFLLVNNIILNKRNFYEKLRFIIFTLIFIIIFNPYLLVKIYKKLGLSIRFIEKSIQLASSDVGISNDRLNIWKQSLYFISTNPIFGNGIGTFYYKTSYNYPHNVIIQMLYELGIPLVAAGIYLFIKKIFIFVQHAKDGEKIFFWYLFSISILELLFSNEYWVSIKYWVFLGYVINISWNFKKRGSV